MWRAGEPDTRLECVLNNNKNSDFCAPLTSFDWNEVDQNLVGTSSIDTTCTIWGLETGQVSSKLSLNASCKNKNKMFFVVYIYIFIHRLQDTKVYTCMIVQKNEIIETTYLQDKTSILY